MTRRQLLKLLLSGAAGYTLDVDRLLWTKTKTIFLPTARQTKFITESQIIAAEFERIVPHIQRLFERDNTFYQLLDGGATIRADRDFRIPLVFDEEK